MLSGPDPHTSGCRQGEQDEPTDRERSFPEGGEGTWSPSPNTGSLFRLLSRSVLRGPKGWRVKSLPARQKRPHDGLVAFRGQEMPTRLVHSLPPGSGPARGPPSPLPTREGPQPGDPRGPEGTLPHSTQARTADGLTRDDASTPSTKPPCPPDPPSEA